MNRLSGSYLRRSELKILSALNRHRKGLTWSELLKETGLSKSTLYEALRRLKEIRLVSKAIRDDYKPVYRAEVTRSVLETLAIIEEFANYTAIRAAIRNADKEAFADALLEVFLVIGAAFVTELQLEAMSSSSDEELQRKLREVSRRIIQASSRVLDKILQELLAEPSRPRRLLALEEDACEGKCNSS